MACVREKNIIEAIQKIVYLEQRPFKVEKSLEEAKILAKQIMAFSGQHIG